MIATETMPQCADRFIELSETCGRCNGKGQYEVEDRSGISSRSLNQVFRIQYCDRCDAGKVMVIICQRCHKSPDDCECPEEEETNA